MNEILHKILPQLYLASQGRILSNISFVFWAMEFQEKLLLRFTDLYKFPVSEILREKLLVVSLLFRIFWFGFLLVCCVCVMLVFFALFQPMSRRSCNKCQWLYLLNQNRINNRKKSIEPYFLIACQVHKSKKSVNQKRFKKIAWIRFHHLHLQ